MGLLQGRPCVYSNTLSHSLGCLKLITLHQGLSWIDWIGLTYSWCTGSPSIVPSLAHSKESNWIYPELCVVYLSAGWALKKEDWSSSKFIIRHLCGLCLVSPPLSCVSLCIGVCVRAPQRCESQFTAPTIWSNQNLQVKQVSQTHIYEKQIPREGCVT